MILIADCGSTKTDWALCEGDDVVARARTQGLNPTHQESEEIFEILSTELDDEIMAHSPEKIYFYGAGCAYETANDRMRQALENIFTTKEIYINSDLLAAARAGCGHAPGIAAILGTGSNSCEYDGCSIVRRVSSGGFILGDEGSAATLGKLFLSDFIKGLIPEEIATDFVSRFTSDYAGIVANVYGRESSPSGYLGSLAPFIMEHYGHPYIKNLVEGNFRSFIRRSIKQYDTGRLAVSVIGSFGYAQQEIFTRIASEEGITVSRFIKAPIDALVEFHIQDAG